MSKREDANYLKKLSTVYKPKMIEWAAMPLVIMNKDSDISTKAHDLAEEVMVKLLSRSMGLDIESTNTQIHKVLDALIDIPLSDFLFMDKVIAINDPMQSGVMEYNYFKVTNVSDNSIRLEYPSLYDGISSLDVDYQGKDLIAMRFYRDEEEYTNNKDMDSVKVKRFMIAMLVTVLSFFKTLAESDLYAVETKGTQHRKIHSKKPWARSDLVTIQFLNKLPSETKEHKGGTHSSPHYHQRRGTWRKLTNKRFRNHPKYGSKIWVKPCWAGIKRTIVNGTTYRVL